METVGPMSRQEHLDAAAELAYERGKADGLREAWDKFCPKCEDRWSRDDNPHQYFCFGLHAPGSDAPEPSYATCPLLRETP